MAAPLRPSGYPVPSHFRDDDERLGLLDTGSQWPRGCRLRRLRGPSSFRIPSPSSVRVCLVCISGTASVSHVMKQRCCLDGINLRLLGDAEMLREPDGVLLDPPNVTMSNLILCIDRHGKRLNRRHVSRLSSPRCLFASSTRPSSVQVSEMK